MLSCRAPDRSPSIAPQSRDRRRMMRNGHYPFRCTRSINMKVIA